MDTKYNIGIASNGFLVYVDHTVMVANTLEDAFELIRAKHTAMLAEAARWQREEAEHGVIRGGRINQPYAANPRPVARPFADDAAEVAQNAQANYPAGAVGQGRI